MHGSCFGRHLLDMHRAVTDSVTVISALLTPRMMSGFVSML
jgi:hypothetical protein